MGIEVLIPHEKIVERVAEIAGELKSRFSSLCTLTVLEGARHFSAMLRQRLAELGMPVEDYGISVSSYGESTESSRKVKISSPCFCLKGKELMIVEDIVDTGNTIYFLEQHLAQAGAKVAGVCALLNKHGRREADVKVGYIGFEIPDLFVVGFGMDLAGEYRELPYIGHIKDGASR